MVKVWVILIKKITFFQDLTDNHKFTENIFSLDVKKKIVILSPYILYRHYYRQTIFIIKLTLYNKQKSYYRIDISRLIKPDN